MSNAVTIRLPHSIAERLKQEARKLGIGLEEYVLELLIQGSDPPERAREYAEASKGLLERAIEQLEKGDIRQAAEKLWGAAALAVKAYAEWREGRRLASHGELWEYTRELMEELGEWVSDSWAQASAMHTCFYEGWCTREHVEQALKRIERLVESIASKIQQ